MHATSDLLQGQESANLVADSYNRGRIGVRGIRDNSREKLIEREIKGLRPEHGAGHPPSISALSAGNILVEFKCAEDFLLGIIEGKGLMGIQTHPCFT